MRCKKEMDYRRSNPESVYELKKVALKLRKKNKSVKEISEITGLSDQTVRNLFRAYDKGGIAAVKPKTRGRRTGEKRHLTAAQEQEIMKLLVDHNPEQYKIKGCLWTRDSVRELIHQKYGIDMPIRTVGELGPYCTASGEAGNESEAGTGGGVVEGTISCYPCRSKG